MTPDTRKKVFSILGTLAGFGILGLALWIFEKSWTRYDPAEVMRRLRGMPAGRLLLAGGFAALSYFTQTLYDYLALVSLKKGPAVTKFFRTSMAAFVSNALTNSMGFSLLTAVSLRFRFYSAWGLNAVEISQIVAVTKLAYFAGLITLTGAAELIFPVELPGAAGDYLSPRILGALLLIPVAVLLLWNGNASGGKYLHLSRWRIVRPERTTLLMQVAVSSLHLVFSGFTLYFLLPQHALDASGLAWLPRFFSVYMAIKFVVLFFPIPGGLGVLEGTGMALLTPALPEYTALGALVAYRIVYFFIPFAAGLLILIAYESLVRSGLAARIRERMAGSRSGSARSAKSAKAAKAVTTAKPGAAASKMSKVAKTGGSLGLNG